MIEPQNTTDPERDPDESGPDVEPRVQIFGDPIELSEQVRKALVPAFSTTELMRDALLPSLTAIEHLREIFKPIELPKIELPKIDSRAFVPPPYRKLEFGLPMPPPPVVPAHIAEVTEAVNAQTDAIVVLHRAIEAQADRADNRDVWLVWLTVALVGLGILTFLELILGG